jgi:hypothetical protein
MLRSDFHIPRLKDSVKELAAKVRLLKSFREELKRKWRAGDRNPFVEHKTSESELVLLCMTQVVQKLRVRSSCSRYHQLAYAFARGMPYLKVEPKTRPGNRPSVMALVEVLKPTILTDRTATMVHLPAALEEWLAQRDRCLLEVLPQAAA